MAHVVEVKINGLAGREEPFEHKMDRHVNIFFGPNGCGKTSLLKIIRSAMEDDASSLTNVPFKSASVTIYSQTYKDTCTRTIDKPISKKKLAPEEGPASVINQEASIVETITEGSEGLTWKTTSKQPMSSKWYSRYLPTTRLLLGETDARTWAYHQKPGQPFISEQLIDTFFAESINKLWTKYTSILLGTINQAQETGLSSILKAVLSPKIDSSPKAAQGLEPDQAFDRVKKFLSRQKSLHLLSKEEDFKSRYKANVALRRIVIDIDKVERKIENASSPRKQLEEVITTLFSGGKSVEFSDQSIIVKAKSGANIGIASLSSGEKHLLMILVETLLSKESSVIIDEPEISMHVDWQTKLVKIMRTLAPEAQLIMATHSPEIMADISDTNIKRM